jgi:hypothetical protein
MFTFTSSHRHFSRKENSKPDDDPVEGSPALLTAEQFGSLDVCCVLQHNCAHKLR